METQPEKQKQNQPERELTKRERRHMRKEEKKIKAEQAKKTKGAKNLLIWLGVLVLALAAGFGIYKYLFSGTDADSVAFDPTNSCVTHAGGGMHIHPTLRIDINGKRQEIPANIGISPGCMRPLHTHDTTEKLHIEFPQQRDFTLGEFFKVWGKEFSSSQIFDNVVDDNHALSVTVNGHPNTEFEKLILKDADQIEIKYKSTSE